MQSDDARLHFLASSSESAQAAHSALTARYGQTPLGEAATIVALGGDGFMLHTQLDHLDSGIPIYGMNKGTVGFLMNEYGEGDLPARIARAVTARIHPLAMVATDADGAEHRALAFNEVSLFRQSAQAAKLRITIDGAVRMPSLVCDGLLVATPQGSTAYNLSARGPILPLKAPLLALTPVSPFRPRNWSGALLSNLASVRLDVLEAKKRPVNAVADNQEIKSAVTVTVREDREKVGLLLYDPEHSWDERILNEQFRA